MTDRKQKLFETLDGFVNQRPGIDPMDYGSMQGYRKESRSVTKDMHDYYAIRKQIAWRDSIDADAIIAAANRRLTITDMGESADINGEYYPAFKIDYCAGQYMPTEYRKAAAAVLASAWWDVTRTDCPDFECDNSGNFTGSNPGEWMRDNAKRVFGRSLQRGYFG